MIRAAVLACARRPKKVIKYEVIIYTGATKIRHSLPRFRSYLDVPQMEQRIKRLLLMWKWSFKSGSRPPTNWGA